MSDGEPPARAAAVLDGRFLTAEAWMRLATLEDRVAAVRYLDGLVSRPPLTTKPFKGLAYLLAALAADIELTAIDPESPVIEGLGQVPQPHPGLYEELPVPETGPFRRSTLDELKAALGGIFR